jgi:hypothetical protein
LAGGALVAAVGVIARRWTASATLGFLAALLVAADPNCLYYGREARPYAWVALLALAHVIVFRRRLVLAQPLTRRATARHLRLRIAWITLSWALFYTHYTSLLLLPAQFLYLAVTPLGRRACRRIQFHTWIADTACVLIGCLPAISVLWQIAERRDNWSRFVKPQSLTALWTLFPCHLYLGAPIILAALLFVWDRRCARRVATRRLKAYLPLLACWYFVPVGIAWAMTYAGAAPLLHRRYVWVAVTALFLHAALWGTVAATRRGPQLYAGLLLLCAIAYWVSLPRLTWTIHTREDWRTALALIAADDRSARWPILLRAGLIEDRQLSPESSGEFREYCTFPLRGLYSVADRPGAMIPLPSDRAEALDAPTRRIIAAAPGAWLVYRGEVDRAVQVTMGWQRQLRAEHIRIDLEHVHAFSGVTIIELSVNK